MTKAATWCSIRYVKGFQPRDKILGGNEMICWLTIYASKEMRQEHVLERVKFEVASRADAESKVASGAIKTEYPLEYFKIAVDKK